MDIFPEDIFNADETELYFQCLPDKTLAFKSDQTWPGPQQKSEKV